MNIKAMSKQTGLSAHTLRYYEKIGLILGVDRDSKGHRDYSEKDIIWIEFIKRLKATRMPLDEIRKFATLRLQGKHTIGERLKMLENHHRRVETQMQDLLANQQKIKEKIELCRKGGELPALDKKA